MKQQSYFHTPFEDLANVCDLTKALYINCAGVVDDRTGFRNHAVRNDYYLMYIHRGSMHIEFDQTSATISAGDLLIMKPGTVYSYCAEKGGGINYLWIHFTGSDAEKIIRDHSIPLNCICSCGLFGDITEYWKKLFQEFLLKDDHFISMTACIFTQILTIFSRRINTPNEKRRFLKSISYIHENYQSKINVRHLASLENLSESHYRAIFTQTFGESPIGYITSRRIEAAAYMLENTDKPLHEISELAGYHDVYYFGRLFKQRMGITPGRYRKYKSKV